MEPRRPVRRTLALVSAALLVAGFVLYRAGVIGPLYMSGSKSNFVFVGSSVTPPSPKPDEQKPAPAPDKKGE